MKKKMIKFISVVLLFFVILFVQRDARSASCSDAVQDVNNSGDFEMFLGDDCANMNLLKDITVGLSFPENDSAFTIVGEKNITFDLPEGSSISLKNGTFSNLSTTIRNGNFTGSNLNFHVLYVSPAPVVNCSGCKITDGSSVGQLNFDSGSIDGIFSIGSGSVVPKTSSAVFTKMKFNFDAGRFLDIGRVKADISGSEFLITDARALKISNPDNKLQVVKLTSNKYLAKEGRSIFIESLFDAAVGSVMQKMVQPAITYDGYDNENYKLRIDSSFDDKSWGGSVCANNAQGRNISFEPYWLKYSGDKITGVYPVGLYGYETDGTVKYLKIPRTTKVENQSLDSQSIAILVHCEGTGTTRFSNIIQLKCAAGEEYSNGACRTTIACTSNGNCTGTDICKEGACVSVECSDAKPCPAGQECQNNACIEKPKQTCATDSDCAADMICKVGTCVTKPIVVPSCATGETYDPENKICTTTTVPPAAERGGGCSLVR